MTEQKLKSSFQGQMLFRGVPYGYFDRTGHLPIWDVLNIFRDGLNNFYKYGYLDFDRLTEGKALFSVGLMYTATEEFYTRATFFKPVSMLCTSSLKSFGKSSFEDIVILSDEETGSLFAQVCAKLVLVDKEKGESIPLPDWFVTKYGPIIRSKVNSFRECEWPLQPEKTFQHTIKTQHTDLDQHGHVATLQYFRFCTEAILEASASGFYCNLEPEIILFPVLKAEMMFLKQCKQGEELCISTWQCQKDPQTIYFVIRNGNADIIESKFTFGVNKMEPISSKL